MRVALGCSEGRLEALAAALAERGHQVMRAPLIETRPRRSAAVRRRAQELLGCPWLLFSSRTSVAAWWTLTLPLEHAHGVAGPKLGVVGPGTAAEVTALGGRVTLLAAPPTAAGLAASFIRHPLAAGPVGLPQGNLARPLLRETLAAAGFEVWPLTVYETHKRAWQVPGEVEVVVLASPSAVAALPERVARTAKLVALGPTTGAAVRSRGWRCRQAEAPTTEAVMEQLERLVSHGASG